MEGPQATLVISSHPSRIGLTEDARGVRCEFWRGIEGEVGRIDAGIGQQLKKSFQSIAQESTGENLGLRLGSAGCFPRMVR